MDDKKEIRAEIFNKALDAAGIPVWGRAARIVDRVGCTPASAQAWVRGSLPSEPERVIEMCDAYDIDLYLWVEFKSRKKSEPINALLDAVIYVKDFETKSNLTLDPEQFAHLCGAYLDVEKRASMEELVSILKKTNI
tara:strand:- start:53 stop:463 length:411 start_codon:yes stop_codon:yes gene_type:complete